MIRRSVPAPTSSCHPSRTILLRGSKSVSVSLTAILSYHSFIFSVASASLSPQFGNAVYQVKHGSVKITKTTGGLSGMLSCSSTLVDVQLMWLRKVLYLRTAELPNSPHIIALFVSLYFIIRVYNIIYFCFTNNMKDYKFSVSNQVSKISGQQRSKQRTTSITIEFKAHIKYPNPHNAYIPCSIVCSTVFVEQLYLLVFTIHWISTESTTVDTIKQFMMIQYQWVICIKTPLG